SERLGGIRNEIARAAESVGRDPASVTLVGVSKTRTLDEIRAMYDLGVRDFGESRWQEALPKIEALPDDVRWHFIGSLQSNKARRIAERFALIHSLDSEGAAKEIKKAGGEVLIEVNLAGEAQKSGINEEALDGLMNGVLHYENVHLRGLMTIGPAHAEIEETRNLFRRLRELNERLGLSILSMGMSDDFAVAIQEGATHVRIGTSLFGARPH
ncbi:YggS family pyridoxal phosphate-dependent enzyme, partial [bacterium]